MNTTHPHPRPSLRQSATVEFVSRVTTETGTGRVHRLLVADDENNHVAVFVAPDTGLLVGLKTGATYRFSDLLGSQPPGPPDTDAPECPDCGTTLRAGTTADAVDPAIAAAASRLDVDVPFGVVDERTGVQRVRDPAEREPDVPGEENASVLPPEFACPACERPFDAPDPCRRSDPPMPLAQGSESDGSPSGDGSDAGSNPGSDGDPDAGSDSNPWISGTDVPALSSFLDEHTDAFAYELTFSTDDDEQTRMLRTVSLVERTLERPAAAPAVACTPLASPADQFTVRVDAIDSLAVADLPTGRAVENADTPGDEATALRQLASHDPEAVPVPRLLALLERTDANVPWQRDALRALRLVADARPEACTPAIPILASVLGRDRVSSPGDALAALRAIGEFESAAVAPVVDDVVPYLEADAETPRREAARCLATVAEDHPEDAVDAVPALATIVRDRIDGQRYAVYALSLISGEYPDAITPTADALGDVILDESVDDGSRLNAAAALGRVVSDYPNVGVDLVEDLTALFDAETPKLRNNAVGLLADVATLHGDVVEPHVDELAGLLTADDEFTRVNASCALSRVASDFPASVDHVVPTVVELLSDDDPLVRKNACWLLGHVRADRATSRLDALRLEDPEESVRTRAAWALAEIESGE